MLDELDEEELEVLVDEVPLVDEPLVDDVDESPEELLEPVEEVVLVDDFESRESVR